MSHHAGSDKEKGGVLTDYCCQHGKTMPLFGKNCKGLFIFFQKTTVAASLRSSISVSPSYKSYRPQGTGFFNELRALRGFYSYRKLPAIAAGAFAAGFVHRFVNAKLAPVEFLTVGAVYGCAGFFIRSHFDKTEAL